MATLALLLGLAVVFTVLLIHRPQFPTTTKIENIEVIEDSDDAIVLAVTYSLAAGYDSEPAVSTRLLVNGEESTDLHYTWAPAVPGRHTDVFYAWPRGGRCQVQVEGLIAHLGTKTPPSAISKTTPYKDSLCANKNH